MKIYAHTLVRNEEKWIWYSVMSIINYVDKALIWDTGSTDKTVEIVKEIKRRYPKKVLFRNVGEVNSQEFTEIRQKMLDETKADWFIVVDGDEIWWQGAIAHLVDTIKKHGKKYESIVVPNILLIGDIFHYLEEAAGRYKLAGREGHYALRGVNTKIPGLKSDKPHGTWGWVDGNGAMIQDRNKGKIKFVDSPYLHASFLPRSSSRNSDLKVPKRAHKLKHELGISFAPDFYYPEIFFKKRPNIVPLPWIKMNPINIVQSAIQTPFKKIKRRLIYGKTGY